ncbi:MAG: hypothetical protein AB1798_24445, partial [Spirochaetota bacterium]
MIFSYQKGWLLLCLLYLIVVTNLFAQQDEKISRIYSSKAGILFQEKKYSEAENLLDSALQFYPENSDALYLKGLLYKANVDSTYDVLFNFEKAIQSGRWDGLNAYDCIQDYAEILLRIGRTPEA